ncbi:MAG TPA: FG-GAP-like repeat-containing protein [Thermoanaerobaculia bacterium]|nr:FG-GAP-like repeat-containing protein [Thermoanaerobaculia bacterium]
MTSRRRWTLSGLLLAGWLADAPAAAAPPPPPSEAAWEHNNQGIGHLADNRHGPAVQSFEKAVAAAPGQPEPRYNLALALSRARRVEEALKVLASPTPLTTPRALVLKARALASLNRTGEAFAAWEEARRGNGLDTPSLWHLAKLLQRARRHAQAAEVLAQIPAVPAVVETDLAEALAETGQIEKALATAKKAAAELVSGDEEAAALLAEAEEAGNAPAARTSVSMLANILRSSAAYLAGAELLARHGPGSAISEEPLLLAGKAEPGAAPPPLRPAGETVPAGSATALCVAGRDLLALAALECAVADLDQDGATERIVAGPDAVLVLWQEGEPARLPGAAEGLTVFDYDLDGDADLALAGASGLRLVRNNRDRTFTDVTAASGLATAAPGAAAGAIAADFTGDGKAELVVLRATAPALLLGGLQQEKIRALGTPGDAPGPATALDCDHDGDLDLALAGRLAVNDGLGTFSAEPFPATAGAARLGAVDLDQDGFQDLLALAPTGLQVFRGTEECAFTSWPGAPAEVVRDVAVLDKDGDAAPELALLTASEIRFLESPVAGRSIVLAPQGTKDNTGALGSRVDVWAGRLRLHREIRLGTHEIGFEGAPLPLGLGARSGAQFLRVLWPNNTWLGLDNAALGLAAVEQSRDLDASCPFLYAWDGERYAFVTDLLGGSPLGLPLARNIHMPTDPDEYVLIPRERVAEKDGRYELKVTLELREMLYLDRAELLVVDRPEEAVAATDDALKLPPFPPAELYASETARPPVAAVDQRGKDVRDLLAAIDGRYPHDFSWIRFQGYAETHSLTLDFDPPEDPARAFLVLTGSYYWSEADNLALSQAQTIRGMLPRLEAWVDGRWETVLDPMPFPGGRWKTIAIDLAGRLQPGPVRLRITTNLRLYFDRILLATRDLAGDALTVRRLAPVEAVLGRHGYSELLPFDGRVPPFFDYHRTRPGRPYAAIEGFYTRYGDVMPLLEKVDNASAVLHHGDEVTLSFEAPPPPPAGWVREVFFYSVGWDKDAHPNTETGKTVEPLPFHGMKAYPYTLPERYPWTPGLLELEREYRTRWIPRD